MSRKQVYLTIFGVIVGIVLAGIYMQIQAINTLVDNTFVLMQDPKISVTAIVCSFIFMGNRNYWVLIPILGIATAYAIEYYTLKDVTLITIAYRAFTFVFVVYLLNLIKFVFNR